MTEQTEPVISSLDLSSAPETVAADPVSKTEGPEIDSESGNTEGVSQEKVSTSKDAQPSTVKAPSLESEPTPSRVFLF
jgi:hypothetical protein